LKKQLGHIQICKKLSNSFRHKCYYPKATRRTLSIETKEKIVETFPSGFLICIAIRLAKNLFIEKDKNLA
jgi:hypothetical protein